MKKVNGDSMYEGKGTHLHLLDLQPSPLEDLHPPTPDTHTAEYIAPVQSGMAALAEK